MRKLLNSLFIICVGVGVSCGKKADSQLTLELKPDTSFVLPGDNEVSCYEDEISGPRLMYPRMVITWSGEGKFYPATMKLKFRSNQLGGEYTCTLEDNFTFLFQNAETKEFVQANYFLPGTYELQDRCAIECGGVRTADENRPFKIAGELKVVGYSIDEEGTQLPRSGRVTIFLQNLP